MLLVLLLVVPLPLCVWLAWQRTHWRGCCCCHCRWRHQDHLLPEEYVGTMRQHMLDRCPVSSYAEVQQIIREDLGAPPEELFARFSEAPIASASLAQVHAARLRDGSEVAVKVQHAGLRESCAADTTTIEWLIKAAHVVFPDFNYQWLVDEIKTNLPLELDFTHEARNAARCRRNLQSTRSTVAKRCARGRRCALAREHGMHACPGAPRVCMC